MATTRFDKGLQAYIKPIISIIRKAIARTVEEGNRNLIYAAAIAVAETHSKFIQNNQVVM